MSVFRERINLLMKENDMSIRTMAEFADMPWQTINSYCTKDVDARAYNLVKIAMAFGVTTDWLLGITDRRNND